MKIIYDLLPKGEYIPAEVKKELIVLHHTVSSTARSAIEWWKQEKARVGVAFVIDKDGTIYQLFEPKFWAYHIGKGSNDLHNQRSIGIEIVNEGVLCQKVVGNTPQFFWFDGKYQYKGSVHKNAAPWRGSYFFADYTLEQTVAAAELVKKLCKDFQIPKTVLTDFGYNASRLMHKGICSHHNLRADKTDLSPAFDFGLFQKVLNEK